MVKLTSKSLEVLNYVRDHGGRCAVADVAEGLGRTVRSVNPNITDLCSEKKGLAMREKVAAEEEGAKDIVYVVLTDDGMAYTAPADDEE